MSDKSQKWRETMINRYGSWEAVQEHQRDNASRGGSGRLANAQVLNFTLFVFSLYAADRSPSREQLKNALRDFNNKRKRN